MMEPWAYVPYVPIVVSRDTSDGKQEWMFKWIKRALIVILVGFVAFFVIGYPAQSADALKTFFSAVQGAFWRVLNFFASLG